MNRFYEAEHKIMALGGIDNAKQKRDELKKNFFNQNAYISLDITIRTYEMGEGKWNS